MLFPAVAVSRGCGHKVIGNLSTRPPPAQPEEKKADVEVAAPADGDESEKPADDKDDDDVIEDTSDLGEDDVRVEVAVGEDDKDDT